MKSSTLQKKLDYLLEEKLITEETYLDIMNKEERFRDMTINRKITIERINGLIDYSKLYDLKYK